MSYFSVGNRIFKDKKKFNNEFDIKRHILSLIFIQYKTNKKKLIKKNDIDIDMIDMNYNIAQMADVFSEFN